MKKAEASFIFTCRGGVDHACVELAYLWFERREYPKVKELISNIDAVVNPDITFLKGVFYLNGIAEVAIDNEQAYKEFEYCSKNCTEMKSTAIAALAYLKSEFVSDPESELSQWKEYFL